MSPAEAFLHEGRLSEGETALLLTLDADPTNDEARFGLGVLQFVQAVERLGQALHEYGVNGQRSGGIFLRLPVPPNEDAEEPSYKEACRVIDLFLADLDRAERTLAGIEDDDVKLRLRLSKITLNLTGDETGRVALIDVLTSLNGGRFEFQEINPDFRVHFDRGDVAWLRAYCHLLSAMGEAVRAVDWEAAYNERTILDSVRLGDPQRLRRARLHVVAVCELNRETWEHIRDETDDDYEWLPHPRQNDQLGLPISDAQIDGWLRMMDQIKGLFTGERLFPSGLIQLGLQNHPAGQGLNVKTLLDDPPTDLMNEGRLRKEGIDPRYLEAEGPDNRFEPLAILGVVQLFSGPFGIARSVRMN
ncbi:hypothetical protein [Alienimonas chondri]|uniref:hypothetical protein n=1 Tax=Alienimonas chondri TaxID=2681879 RepID=UPI001489F81E|nr:hypothetical protein [Alienimonas chondri]